MATDVPGRHLQSLGADVRRPHLGVGGVVSDRDGDAAAARPDIRDAERFAGFPRDRDGALDEDLGVRVRDQDGRTDLEVQAHELFVPDKVGDGLPLATPGDQRAIRCQLALIERPVELQVEVEAPDVEGVRQQELSVEARRTGTVLLEVFGGKLQDLGDGHEVAGFSPFS
jgi:hypothetical protein